MVWGKWSGRQLGENECEVPTWAAPGREWKRGGFKGWYDFVEVPS